MPRQSAGVILGAHQQPFPAEAHPVRGIGHASIVLTAFQNIIVVSAVLDIPGVIEIQAVLLAEGRAGIRAVDVIGLVAVQHDRAPLPGEQIAGFIVPPELHAAASVEGRVLIEHMVLIPKTAQAVGVVEPAGGRRQMKAGPPGAVLHRLPFRRRGQVDQILVQRIHGTPPSSHGPVRPGSPCPEPCRRRSGWSHSRSRRSSSPAPPPHRDGRRRRFYPGQRR